MVWITGIIQGEAKCKFSNLFLIQPKQKIKQTIYPKSGKSVWSQFHAHGSKRHKVCFYVITVLNLYSEPSRNKIDPGRQVQAEPNKGLLTAARPDVVYCQSRLIQPQELGTKPLFWKMYSVSIRKDNQKHNHIYMDSTTILIYSSAPG